MIRIGWKTILGAILYGAGTALPAAWPQLAPVGPYLSAAGAILGGVGVAHKGAKMLDALQAIADTQTPPSQER